MMLIWSCLRLLYAFFKIGMFGFGGGYAMMSMIMAESEAFGITASQLADLNALDMVIPGPIAINAATYVGYLHAGFWGALAATVGVSLPSFFFVAVVARVLRRYQDHPVKDGILLGVKPAAVGLVAAAAMMIAAGVLLNPGHALSGVFMDPLGTVSLLMAGIFLGTAVANIRFAVNPILLTLLAGIVGAVFAGG